MLSKRADVAFVRDIQIRRNEDYEGYVDRIQRRQNKTAEDEGPAKLDLEIIDITLLTPETAKSDEFLELVEDEED